MAMRDNLITKELWLCTETVYGVPRHMHYSVACLLAFYFIAYAVYVCVCSCNTSASMQVILTFRLDFTTILFLAGLKQTKKQLVSVGHGFVSPTIEICRMQMYIFVLLPEAYCL